MLGMVKSSSDEEWGGHVGARYQFQKHQEMVGTEQAKIGFRLLLCRGNSTQ